ncbi:MAG: hypothetical protein ACKPKK_10630 [Dolichospermum sp.]
MLSTIAKRIQSRLSRQGVKVSLAEIKEQCDRLIADIDNPTEIELLAVQEYFMSAATSLTVINDISDVRTQSIQDTDDISNDDDSAIAVPSPNETITNEPAPLATTNKSELIASTAGELGIVLNTGEIELIAQNVNYSSDDLRESLDEIKSAIIAFVRHKIALNSQKIDDTLQEITQVAADGFNQNSEQLTTGLKQLNRQLVQQSTDFKSKIKATLSVFQLPAA